MMRSGMAATLRAVRYSGFFSKREEFSRVELSSVREKGNVLAGKYTVTVVIADIGRCLVATYPCRLARTRAREEG